MAWFFAEKVLDLSPESGEKRDRRKGSHKRKVTEEKIKKKEPRQQGRFKGKKEIDNDREG